MAHKQTQGTGKGNGLAAWCAAILGALAVLVTVAGGLVTVPLGATGAAPAFFAAIGVLGGLAWLSAGGRLRRPVAWLLPLFWLGFALWAPHALARTPDTAAGELELGRLWPCLALSLAVLGFSRGSLVGVTGLRLGWFAGLVLSVGIATWEIATRQHLWIDDAHPWIFGDTRLAVGTYINPNNFATALVAMIAGSLALAAGLRARWAAGVLYAVVAFGCATVIVTQSRLGVIALAAVLALEARRRVLDHRVAGGQSVRDRFAALPYATRQALWSLLSVLMVFVVAAFVVPSFAARNPLVRMVADQFSEETARSDSLRLQLIAAGGRYLRESDWLGSGAGSFEPLLSADASPGTLKLTNLHNAFVELLVQYGVHIGAAYTLVVVGVMVALVRSRRAFGGMTRIARYEACGHLIAVVALGIAASSALHVPTWWVALAAAVACAWQVSAVTAQASHARTGSARPHRSNVPEPAARVVDAQAEAAARAVRNVGAAPAPIGEAQAEADGRRREQTGAP